MDLDDAPEPGQDGSSLATAVTGLGAVLAAVFARKALTAVWGQLTGQDPPENPAAPETSWQEALLWGAAAGLVAGLARTVGQRMAAGALASVKDEDASQLA